MENDQIMRRKVRVLFSSNKNPNFETFTDYIEKAFKEVGCEIVFFENRDFVIPGRIRDRFAFLHDFDINILNKRVLKMARDFKPDLFLEDGGWNILPKTLNVLKGAGIKTALWTNDPPRDLLAEFEPIKNAAPCYDFVFITGTEAVEPFQDINELHLLPFACDPDFQKPVMLTDTDKKAYKSDVCFVGSGHVEIYPDRIRLLESLAELNIDLSVWGPGWETLPDTSPLKKKICGSSLKTAAWVRLFSAAKIIFHSHYQDPLGGYANYQVNPRVFEALACGAFLLVDDQKDIRTLFQEDEHLVIYHNAADLKKKVLYYIENDTERKRIAENGRREVLQKHTYRHRVEQILTITGLAKE
jgi:spore maturation protein CgeB